MENQGSYYGSWDYPYHSRDMYQSFESQSYYSAPEYQFNEEPFQDFCYSQQYQPQYDFHPEFQWQNQYQLQHGAKFNNYSRDMQSLEPGIQNLEKLMQTMLIKMESNQAANEQRFTAIEASISEINVHQKMMETQIAQIAQSIPSSSTLPSQPQPNPRGECKATSSSVEDRCNLVKGDEVVSIEYGKSKDEDEVAEENDFLL